MRKQALIDALSQNGIQPAQRLNTVYAYLDGPTIPPVESEWLLEFFFDKQDELINFSISHHLVGP